MNEIEWSPTIGDPTLMGWVTVVAYFVTAWLCLRAFRLEKRGPPRPLLPTIAALARVMKKHWPRPPAPARRAALWLLLFAIMFALGVNKQLDLQTLFTEIGRSMSRSGGWYEERRSVQGLFVAAMAGFGAIGLAILWWLTRGQLRDFRLTLAGLAFIVCFVVIRAASFHKIDEIIGMELFGVVRMNWVLELAGIGLMAAGVIRRIRAAKAEPTNGSGAAARAKS
ncbi:MAG TPA: hypothetical protein VFG69_05375 [Nannocystaceae bacterium]|nr:hypothetical protein [Nannocystaceae bacterium]